MSEQQKLTTSQFTQQLKLLLRPVKQLIIEMIQTPIKSISERVDKNIFLIDGRPISIEGNEQIIEVENGSDISILSNGFWETVSFVVENDQIKTEPSTGGAPILIYPDSLIYYIQNGVVNCCYVLAVNREITLFPTVTYKLHETALRVQDIKIQQFTSQLENILNEFIKKLKVLISMIDDKVDNIIEQHMNDLILMFEDAIVLLPDRSFDNPLITPQYVVDFFLKSIETLQYFQRCY
ncbi:Uncharacterized protein QTN25_006166 [Entamoeba marina]